MRRYWLRVGDAATGVVLLVIGIATGVALLLPTLVVIIASFTNTAYLSFPPEGISLRWYRALLLSPEILRAGRVSLSVAGVATMGSLAMGLATAFPLVRGSFRGRDALLAFTLAPLMLPSVVLGIALLFFFGFLGIRLSFVTLVLSHILITFPYVTRTCTAALFHADPALEEAGVGLGASRWQTLCHVTLPLLLPGLTVGAGFAFIESFDNLALSIFVAGQRQETLPMRLFQLLITDIDPVVAAVATVLVAGSFLLLFLVTRLAGFRQLVSAFGGLQKSAR